MTHLDPALVPKTSKLFGGGGLDIMRGGKGDDTFSVSEAADQVFGALGNATDTVVATISSKQAADKEIETLRLGA